MFGWLCLRAELHRWDKSGRRPRLWWRDDDARAPTPQLRRLLVTAGRARVPLSLSIIPDGVSPELCVVLEPYTQVTILQHGCRHLNEGGLRPSEFSSAAAPEEVAAQLARGWAALEGFKRRLSVYVPPWNALTPNVEAALTLSGHQAVSAWGGRRRPDRVDAHIDLMRWGLKPRFAGRERVLGKLRRQLRRRRRQGLWEEPVGILTHHLVHDEDAWRFLGDLLLFPPVQTTADWPEASALFGCPLETTGMNAGAKSEGSAL